MKNANGEFSDRRHRLEGFVGMLVAAAWVVGSVVALGLQAGATA